ncbi:nicotinate-nucleotide adenylyltransferase [Candidatus Fukatsuia symbiotica]|uniref:Probable nicotinate-nucleotide adenylyltransferase n=1 Tax=Candidatus Fukatsuia symbiotica TaxID=1878942 RepID=A0A2U8I7R0_9GAMM|nr:nicotinate-nucleotide adenylyltransferase [Candidatus Fukatsuia symbiotica]AWK15147.1 nicotinic acid mononucleotide adenylyltransferase [Candidatus Fukatsuia symbiotica]MEA9443971.1 nicotinate-nucleotide adenylyltransferase [Candidatus Fukatsuia symbiotica]
MSTKATDQQQAISSLYALFGGTFDPIHYGHLRPIEVLAQQLGLQQVILLPNHVPPHRPQPEANPWQRLKMVELAVADNPLFRVDARELQSSRPSYTIDTLEIIRQQQGAELPLAFIIGQDSLLSLHKWHRWQSLLDVCHLLVCTRPGYSNRLINTELQRWLGTYQINDAKKLNQQPKGYIYLANTPLLDISATDIRRRYHQRQRCDYLLPRAVQQYIELQDLYR